MLKKIHGDLTIELHVEPRGEEWCAVIKCLFRNDPDLNFQREGKRHATQSQVYQDAEVLLSAVAADFPGHFVQYVGGVN